MKAIHWCLVAPLLALSCDSWPGVSDGGVTGGASQIEDSSGNFGSSCSQSDSCATGLTCITAAPNGLCTKVCTSDGECALFNGKCMLAFGSMVCVKTCAADQMCRPSYSCQSQVCLQGTPAGADL